MTPIQACEETKQLWTKIADYSVERQRIVWKEDIPGPWEDYINTCPCCQCAFSEGDCYFCPMLPEWFRYADNMKVSCENPRSPFVKWSNFDYLEGILCIDIEFFCLLIAEMADEAIMRLKKESRNNVKI